MPQNIFEANWEPGECITKVSFKHLENNGIKLILLDVDGTLLSGKNTLLHSKVIDWVQKASEIFKLHLLSNNPSKERIKSVANQLDITFTYDAKKPSSKTLMEAINLFKYESNETAIIGDKIFTDIIAGNRIGVYTVLVKTIGKNGETINRNLYQRMEKKLANFLGG